VPLSFEPKRGIILPFVRQLYVLRAAAAIVAVVGAISLYLMITSRTSVDQTSMTFSSMQSLRLEDGTKITFDVGSSFAYPKNFQDGKTREVFLMGEAYFDVARNEHHPFVVHANGGKIEVLGTKFNVRAWGPDQTVVVAVQEGKVAFQSEENRNENDVVVLVEHTMSKLMKGASPSPPESADISRYISWMKREAYFQDTSVPEVLSQLERWYHVSIQSNDSTFLKGKITVFVENKPLIDNLRLIAVTMNVRFEQEGEVVRFLANR
jgi:ferric-dicitrate binding protein FerR (iron transport regulator)